MAYGFEPAKPGGDWIKIAIAGTTNAGKSRSAMRIAAGIVGSGNRFAVLDTEHGRANRYAAQYAFDRRDILPPFEIGKFVDAASDAVKAGYKALMVDSWSHTWMGEGGMADQHEAEMQRLIANAVRTAERYNKAVPDEMFLREKNNAPAWMMPKVVYKKEMSRLLILPIHIIFCLRAEDKLLIEQQVDDNGRKRTVFIAAQDRDIRDRWIPICCHNPEFMYEVDLSFVVTPENPGVGHAKKRHDQVSDKIGDDRLIDEDVGRIIVAWADGKLAPAPGGAEVRNTPAPSDPPPDTTKPPTQAPGAFWDRIANEAGLRVKTAAQFETAIGKAPSLEHLNRLVQDNTGEGCPWTLIQGGEIEVFDRVSTALAARTAEFAEPVMEFGP